MADSRGPNIGANLPAGTNFSTDPVVIDANTYLVVCSGWGKGTNGTYRTEDGGTTWTLVSKTAGNYPALWASDKSLYWALAWNNGLIRSTDLGLTWSQVAGYNTVTPNTPIELSDQRLVMVGPKQQLLVSSNHGASWASFLDPIPDRAKSRGTIRRGTRTRSTEFVLRLQVGLPDHDAVRCDLAV